MDRSSRSKRDCSVLPVIPCGGGGGGSGEKEEKCFGWEGGGEGGIEALTGKQVLGGSFRGCASN